MWYKLNIEDTQGAGYLDSKLRVEWFDLEELLGYICKRAYYITDELFSLRGSEEEGFYIVGKTHLLESWFLPLRMIKGDDLVGIHPIRLTDTSVSLAKKIKSTFEGR